MTPQEKNNHSYLIVIPGAIRREVFFFFVLLKYQGQDQGQSVFI